MGYDASDMIDIIEELETLLETHKDYDSIELVENSESFENDFSEILKRATKTADIIESEYEDLEEKNEDLEEKVDDLEDKLENYNINDGLSLYELQKKCICSNLLNNMSLLDLEILEQLAITNNKAKNLGYFASSFSDLETN